MLRVDRRILLRLLAVAVPSLAAATAAVWLLQDRLGFPNASAVYLLPVIGAALVSGTLGAIASAVAGILLYDYFFTEPLHTLVIREPGVWLNLVLLLVVGLVVGELTALLRARADVAGVREREARELFRVSRALATRSSTAAVLPDIARLLADATGIDRISLALGPDDALEREVANSVIPFTPPADVASGPGEPGPARRPPVGLPHDVLRRMPGDEPARWVRVHPPGRARTTEPERLARYRVRIEAAGAPIGSIWAERRGSRTVPDRTATRLLAAAADQIGQALAQDRLAGEAGDAEVSRRSDALRAALLQSVSHDLRTPLSAIRAAAGSLRPDSGLGPDDRRASAEGIEREVVRLDRLVRNLLDMSRIEAGVLRAEREAFELDDLVRPIVDRMAFQLAGRTIRVDVGPEPVLVDPVFVDEIVTNLLDNAAKFTPAGAAIRVIAVRGDDGERSMPPDAWVTLTVEDAGPGIHPSEESRIFDKFYRVAGRLEQARPGTGVGLAVVRGLAEAMGAAVVARKSDLGGLAVDVRLPAADLPPELR